MQGKLHLCTAIHRWDQPLWSDLAQQNWKGIATWVLWCRFDWENSAKHGRDKKHPMVKVMYYLKKMVSILIIKENHARYRTANLKLIIMWYKYINLDILHFLWEYLVLYGCIKKNEMKQISERLQFWNHYSPKHVNEHYSLRACMLCFIWIMPPCKDCFNHAFLKFNHCCNKVVLMSLAVGC